MITEFDLVQSFFLLFEAESFPGEWKVGFLDNVVHVGIVVLDVG